MTFPFRLLLLLIGLCLLSCGKPDDRSAYVSIPISATVPAIADMVRQIGGVRVKVDSLVTADTDPMAFENTRAMQARLQSSKLFFHGNNQFEQNIIAVAKNIPALQSVEVGASIGKELRIVDSVTGLEVEPCFWGDASLWEKCIQDVFNGLVALDPESRDVFEQNVTYYREKLQIVHQWALRRAQEIPPQQRLIISANSNLCYFAKAYGFETMSVQTEDDVSKAVDAIVGRGLKTVFNEVGVLPNKIEGVVNLSGAVLNSEIYGYGPSKNRKVEDFQAETYDTSNYVGMLKHNMNTLVKGLR